MNLSLVIWPMFMYITPSTSRRSISPPPCMAAMFIVIAMLGGVGRVVDLALGLHRLAVSVPISMVMLRRGGVLEAGLEVSANSSLSTFSPAPSSPDDSGALAVVGGAPGVGAAGRQRARPAAWAPPRRDGSTQWVRRMVTSPPV